MSVTVPTLERWYALAVISGRERKARSQIQEKLRRAGLESRHLQIICPDEEVLVQTPGGERESRRRLTLPGYLLIGGRSLGADLLLLMRSVPNTLGFLGGDDHPTPLRPTEIDKMLSRRAADGKVALKVQFSEGDEVRIVEGPMSDFTGRLTEVSVSRQTGTVEVEIFGRATPVQVSFAQMRKA